MCATQGNGETDQEYAQRMASSPEVGKCILSILNEDENVIDLYNKIEVRYFLSEKLKILHPNNTIFENFVNHFIKVFNEKYNLKK